MFEVLKFEECLARMLSKVPSGLDKSESSLIYTACAAVAAELCDMSTLIDYACKQAFPSTASGDALDEFALFYGCARREATPARLCAQIEGAVEVGARFMGGDFTYSVVNADDIDAVVIESEEGGVAPGEYSGELIPIGRMEGVTSAAALFTLTSGTERETDSLLRLRLQERLRAMPFNGNRQSWSELCNAASGVWASRADVEDGVIMLTLCGENYRALGQAELDAAREYLNQNAPVGSVYDVRTVSKRRITISAQVDFAPSMENEAKGKIADALRALLFSIAERWPQAQNALSYLAIHSAIVSVAGVDRAGSIKVDNLTQDVYECENHELFELGGFVCE